MLYLAEVDYSITHYMSDGDPDKREVTRLVEADSPEEAEDKVRKHFESKTSEYSVYYSVSGVDISEVIR